MAQQNDTGKTKALELAMTQIEKQFGEGSIMTLGKHSSLKGEMGVIKTGAITLDLALGIGGVPRGRIVEIFGHCSQCAKERRACCLYRCRTCIRSYLRC
jgi:recombination protein RecA